MEIEDIIAQKPLYDLDVKPGDPRFADWMLVHLVNQVTVLNDIMQACMENISCIDYRISKIVPVDDEMDDIEDDNAEDDDDDEQG